jgi:SAM-dependent methyltransferase
MISRPVPFPTALRQRVRRVLRPPALTAFTRSPVSTTWGFDRGLPIDRYYIEQFVEQHQSSIQGRVLEILNDEYAGRCPERISHLEVMDVNRDNAQATIYADLSAADAIASDRFDCVILTQTLQFIYDTRAALRHTHRILRPGGVLLATVPAVSRVDTGYGHAPDLWRFTKASCERLFGEQFGPGAVEVVSYGNAKTAVSFLLGLASEELSSAELNTPDAAFPVTIAVKAVKV